MRKPITVIAAAALLASCATRPPARPAEPVIVTKEVKIEVPVPCAKAVEPEPEFADNPAAIHGAPDIAVRVALLLAGRIQRDAWIAKQRADQAGCDAP